MLGGYNVQSLVKLLETKFAEQAFLALSKITLIFDSFYDVETLHQAGNEFATKLYAPVITCAWVLGPGPDRLGFRPFRPGLGGGEGGGWGWGGRGSWAGPKV